MPEYIPFFVFVYYMLISVNAFIKYTVFNYNLFLNIDDINKLYNKLILVEREKGGREGNAGSKWTEDRTKRHSEKTVSYTHLDVYKRQAFKWRFTQCSSNYCGEV